MLIESALQLFFPNRCTACDDLCEDQAAAFCRTCAVSVLPIVSACARCGLVLSHAAARCLGCIGYRFSATRAPYEFGGALATAIRRLKWASRPELARPLAKLLPPDSLDGADVIVPVPLHVRRLRQREFNQAALLALHARRFLCATAHVDSYALARTRDTVPQALLSPADRRKNVRDAFVADDARVAGRRVLLVDDVMTTGATADACAHALLVAGATSVTVLTVARAVT